MDIEREELSSSPEKLNESIRIGSAGGFLLIAVLVIAAVSLILWGFTGSIPVTITESVAVIGKEDRTSLCMGAIDINKITGVLPQGTKVNLRMPDGKKVKGEISYMAPQPASSAEIRKQYDDNPDIFYYLTDWMLEILLEDSRYSYTFYIETQEDISPYWHQIAEAEIIIGEVRPVSLLIR